MTTRTAHEYSEDRDHYRGSVLRKTRDPGKCWYEVCPKSTAHYVRRLQKKVKLLGRDGFVLNKLSAGWLAFYRYRRFITTDGVKKTVRELVAVPPDYKFREVQSKPGY